MRQVQLLVFDFDGTLVESRSDLATAVNRVRSEFGLEQLPSERIVPMIREGVRSLMGNAVGRELGEAAVEPAVELFIRHYGECCVDTTHCYDGVTAMLDELSKSFSLAVLSNKPEAILRRILSHLDLSRWFEAVAGGDTFEVRKPNPESIRLLAGKLGLTPQDAVVIGDTETDSATAVAAGCPFVLTEWGFARGEDLPGIEAAYRVREVAALHSVLLGLNRREEVGSGLGV